MVILICIIVFACAFLVIYLSPNQTQDSTQVNEVRPIDGVITEEDMEDYIRWSMEREEFKSKGTLGNSSRIKALTGRIVLGLVLNIFLFGPCFATFTLLNDGDGPIPYLGFDNILFAIREEDSIMPLLIVAIICILAIIGLASIIGWFLASHSEDTMDAWMKKEIERSEKMLAIAEQRMKDEYEEKYNELATEKNLLEGKFLQCQAEKDSDKQIADEKIKYYKNKIHNMEEDFSREKRLWNLEKRELELELKQKKNHKE